jgi:hypothetical protein
MSDGRAECIRWWDALDALPNKEDVECGLQLARASLHPDALWLASQFPAGTEVTRQQMAAAMIEQGDDPRALYIAWRLVERSEENLLLRSAERGYAPAQAKMSAMTSGDESYEWAERAAASGDGEGLFRLGQSCHYGRGCCVDTDRATSLYRSAAELGLPAAQVAYGWLAFGDTDWRRFLWHGRAAMWGENGRPFLNSVLRLFASFARGENGRVLHTVVPVMQSCLATPELLGVELHGVERRQLNVLLELHEAMLGRAREAIACWSIVARRRGMAKDMRVMVAQMAWEEAWQWSEGRLQTVGKETSSSGEESAQSCALQ